MDEILIFKIHDEYSYEGINDMNKTNEVGIQHLRNVCGKTLMEKGSNDGILQECGVKETLTRVREIC